MKHQTLVTGSLLAALVIAVVIGVGVVSGYSVFKPFITVDPVSDKNIGDAVTITGKTSLPAGTELLIEAYPASFEDKTGTGSGVFFGATGTVTVTRGSGIVNTWSWPLDTSTFPPMDYLISVSTVTGDISKGNFAKGDTSASTTFTLSAASPDRPVDSLTAADASVVNGIVIDPIPDTTAGTPLAVTGKTSLPIGTDLNVKVVPASTDTETILRNYQNPEKSAEITVVKGDGTDNHFSVTLDTRNLSRDAHIIVVSSTGSGSGDSGWTGSAIFNIISSAGTSAASGILIDPVPDTPQGTSLTVTGKTSLPAGTDLNVKVVPASTDTETILRNYQNPEKSAEITVVKGDGTDNHFSVTLDTRNLSRDAHIIVVSSTGSGSGDNEWTGSAIFNILSTGTQSQGSGRSGYIRVDPIFKKTTGDLVLITGSTSLPSGTNLMASAGNWGGNTVVNAGTGGTNRYSIPMDTASFHPGILIVNVTEMTGDPAKGNYVPGPVHGLTTFVLGGSFLGSDTPVQVTPTASDFITLNKIGDRSVGDQFLITGTTSLPVGASLLWQVMPDTGTTPATVNKTAMGLGGSNMVTKGSSTANRVSFAADMNQMPAGKWAVLVGVMKDGEFEVENPIATAYFTLS
jgi:hypothetical protein